MSNLLKRKSVIRVNDFLKKFKKSINLITLDESARTAKDAANALNTEVGTIVKSLLFKDPDNKFYLCLVSGDKYLSTTKISLLIGNKIFKANADECKEVTGFSIGGVSPVAHTNEITKIFIDENLSRYETVYAAAGHPYIVFGILFDDLCKITNGSIESFVD